ncbi:MAG: RNA polymerase sigma factor [Gammaproteobacteria bacterium]
MNRDSTLRAWLDDHGAMIERIAYSYERRPALVAELVQETALALWRALPSFRGDSSEKTFIARIAHNVSVSHVRKAARARWTPLSDALSDTLADEQPTPDEHADQRDRRALLLNAVRDLPLSLRPVMTLHLEGFSNGEIAEALSLTANNVGVRLTRGKTHLKKQLGNVT